MRKNRRRIKKSRFTVRGTYIAVVNDYQNFSFLKPIDGVKCLEDYGYHNHFKKWWIVIHLKSGLMVRKFKTEKEASDLVLKMQMQITRKWNPELSDITKMIEMMRAIKKLSGRNPQVCFESLAGHKDDIPF